MSMRTLDELRDLAPGYVMQLLTDDELAAFESALRDPATADLLQAEMRAHRDTLELLATSQAVTPPASLRNRVQERLRAEAQASVSAPAPGPAAAPAAAPIATPAPVAPPALTVVRGEKPSRVMPIALALAFAASALIALRLNEQVRALRVEVEDQRVASLRLRDQLSARERTLRTLTDAGRDLMLVRLVPGQVQGANLQLFWNVRSGHAVIFASGLKAITAERTYQLWMIRDGKPVSVALFRPDSTGSQLLNDIPMPSSTTGIAAFAVTEEPAAGSAQPTMTPFLVGTVSAPQ